MPTVIPIRHERDCPGELVHADTKKLSKVPESADGASTDGAGPVKRSGSATNKSTPPLMTAAASPIQRSTTTKEAKPAPRSSSEPPRPSLSGDIASIG